METIYLSRRNLLALLKKLDAKMGGEDTACTIIKHQSGGDAFKQTVPAIAVVAVEDAEYYEALNRPAGEMHPREERYLVGPSTGVVHAGDFQ